MPDMRTVAAPAHPSRLAAEVTALVHLARRTGTYGPATQEYHNGAAQGDHVLVGETPDPFSHLQPRHSCDLVHHEAAGLA